MPRRSYRNIICFILSLLILSVLAENVYSQDAAIGGIVNSYSKVTAIGFDNVTLNNTTSFEAGDTVMLIQMKGITIIVDETTNNGNGAIALGKPGMFEFLTVNTVDQGTKVVTFNNAISRVYDTRGSVQLIKIPSYNTANVTSTLTCQPWDSVTQTGGVLSIIVGKSLTLDADIDVSGKGFAGGKVYDGDGICTTVDPLTYNLYTYPASFTNSGIKGESPSGRA